MGRRENAPGLRSGQAYPDGSAVVKPALHPLSHCPCSHRVGPYSCGDSPAVAVDRRSLCFADPRNSRCRSRGGWRKSNDRSDINVVFKGPCRRTETSLFRKRGPWDRCPGLRFTRSRGSGTAGFAVTTDIHVARATPPRRRRFARYYRSRRFLARKTDLLVPPRKPSGRERERKSSWPRVTCDTWWINCAAVFPKTRRNHGKAARRPDSSLLRRGTFFRLRSFWSTTCNRSQSMAFARRPGFVFRWPRTACSPADWVVRRAEIGEMVEPLARRSAVSDRGVDALFFRTHPQSARNSPERRSEYDPLETGLSGSFEPTVAIARNR